MTEAEKAYQYFVIAVPENEEQAKAYFYARKALQSTLTQPNETPPCYQPDGDGCAYQCYDGDDEPIDKCKECPLCYSDKQRHHAPLNDPLTLDELREMDGEPIYAPETNCWMLITKNQFVPLFTWPDGEQCSAHDWYEQVGPVYRRPPEGEP